MNTQNEAGAVEVLLLAAIALGVAVVAIVRLLLVPLLAVVLVLLVPPRRRPAAAAAAPAVPTFDLSALAAELELLPAAELRAMAGTRARASKAALVSRICAMPI